MNTNRQKWNECTWWWRTLLIISAILHEILPLRLFQWTTRERKYTAQQEEIHFIVRSPSKFLFLFWRCKTEISLYLCRRWCITHKRINDGYGDRITSKKVYRGKWKKKNLISAFHIYNPIYWRFIGNSNASLLFSSSCTLQWVFRIEW